MLPVEVEADAAIYVRKNDGMKFGDAELTNIRYVFYKARFSAVIIDFMNDLNFKQLKDSFISQYGQGYQPNLFLEEIFWRGEKVNVYFHYDKVTEKGDIGYLFNPISKEYKRDQEKKTKKWAKDL